MPLIFVREYMTCFMCEKGKRVSNNSKRHKHQGERKREKKRELGDRKPREERRGKLVSLDPFSLFVFGGARNVEEISLPSRRRNTPRERATRSKSTHSRAEILSERDANDFTREFVSPNSVVHSNTNAQVLDLSQKGGNEG